MVMTRETEIFVRLLDEAVDVWRPVKAVHVRDTLYVIAGHLRDDEVWEFVPGETVECEAKDWDGAHVLIAVRRAERTTPWDVARLSDTDKETIGRALHAVAEGAFFEEWEFQTLFGLSRQDLRAVAKEWPANVDAPMAELAVFNALNNLCGYPLGNAGDLADFGLNREELGRLLRVVRRAEPIE